MGNRQRLPLEKVRLNKLKNTYPSALWTLLWISVFTSHQTRAAFGLASGAFDLSTLSRIDFSTAEVCYVGNGKFLRGLASVITFTVMSPTPPNILLIVNL